LPIVDVEIVTDGVDVDDGDVSAGLAQTLADDIGECLGAAVGTTWVRLRTLPRQRYAESGGGPSGPPPIFVTVLSRRRPEGARMSAIVAEVTAVVAGRTGRPSDRVHVVFDADAAGRVAFGGRIVD